MTSKMCVRVLFRWLNTCSRGEKGDEKYLKTDSEHSSPVEISNMGGFATNLTFRVSVGQLVLGAGIASFGVVIPRYGGHLSFDGNLMGCETCR